MKKDDSRCREDLAKEDATLRGLHQAVVSKDENSWPPNQDGWIFLGRAVEEYGRAKFGVAWTGTERAPRLTRFSLPPYSESRAPRWREARLRANRLLKEHRGDYVARPSVPPPPRPFIFPADVAPSHQDFEFSEKQWKDAQKLDQQQMHAERSREERLTTVYRDLRDSFLDGKVGTGSQINDGTIIELPLEIWALPDPDIFEAFHFNQVMSQSRNGERRLQWVFVAQSDFASFLNSNLQNRSPPKQAANIYFTGAPGRPTAMPFVFRKFKQRCALNEVAATLAGEALFLQAWCVAEHVDMNAPSDKTIANRIRDDFWKYRGKIAKS